MPEYRIYQDFGDFGRELIGNAPCAMAMLDRLGKECKTHYGCELTVRFQGEVLAVVTVPSHGPLRAEVLNRTEHPVDVPYAVQIVDEYELTDSCGWVRSPQLVFED